MTQPTDAGPWAIDVRGLSKSFDGKVAVRGVDLQLAQGEIFGFLGPNGSGKTTTIRMLCGLLTPDSGDGQCLGLDIRRDQRAIQRQVGYMTQKFSLYEDLTIRENLEFVARIYQMAQPRRAVDEAIERLGLGHRQQQLAGALSGGWKQRLALASCMLHQPRLLLLDEPTAGVDPAARRDFWAEIHQLAHDGVTVLVSTHYMDEAERCTRLAYIAWGQLLASGTPQQLLADCGLVTRLVTSDEPVLLARELQRQPEISQVVALGTALHVSGRDGRQLDAAIARLARQWRLAASPTATRLEDLFIQLMQATEDQR